MKAPLGGVPPPPFGSSHSAAGVRCMAGSWLVIGKFRTRKCMQKIDVLEAKIEGNRVPKAHFSPKPLQERKKDPHKSFEIAFWSDFVRKREALFFFSAPRLFSDLFGLPKIMKNVCFSCLFFRARFSTLFAFILGGPDP